MTDGGDNIFVYTGQQDVHGDVTHVRIDNSVKIIPGYAFYYNENLVSVEFHDGAEKIEDRVFYGISLRRLKLNLVTSWKELNSLHSPTVNL